MAGSKGDAAPAWRRYGRRFLGAVAVLLLAGLLLLLGVIVAYRYVTPPFSTLMVAHAFSGSPTRQTWVPLSKMSRHAVTAVVGNEDALYCSHQGVDWGAIREVTERAWRRGIPPRGASTIPMQTAKNMFLWQGRSYLRKAIEIPLAYTIRFAWGRRRVLEVYLNFAEWAPGVFGIEAAARHHFKTSAARLTRRQAARLAAALPNPHVRNAGRPGPRTRRLATIIETRKMKGAARRLHCIYPPRAASGSLWHSAANASIRAATNETARAVSAGETNRPKRSTRRKGPVLVARAVGAPNQEFQRWLFPGRRCRA